VLVPDRAPAVTLAQVLQAAYQLVQAGAETLLFDCGRGVPLRLWQSHVPLRNVTAVFFTHLHSDHVAGFPDFWLTGWLPPPFGHRTERLHIYGPTGTANYDETPSEGV
jgi:ribonuclease Z